MQEPFLQKPGAATSGAALHSRSCYKQQRTGRPNTQHPSKARRVEPAGLGRDEMELVCARAADASESRPCAGATRRRGRD